MTLGSETAAVLMRAMDMLHHQTSSGQHALLCANERRCALQQLLATVETAAKLAEVALAAEHNAAGRDIEHMRVEKEMLQVDAVRIGKEVERAVVETARMKAEGEKVGMETEKVCREIERSARETLRLRMEGEKVRVEVERAKQETERARAELEKVRCETEQRAETANLAAAAGFEPPETHHLSPSRCLPVQIRPTPSPPETAPLSSPLTRITGLYATNHMVEEITDAVGKWNSSNNDQYTPAGWAWFKHSETEAFVFLTNPGQGKVSRIIKARKRTGTINLGRGVFGDLEMFRGYSGFIYGGRNEFGQRDRVAFE
ncbi:hypothetical protein DFP73DRAFT_567204 [Morchella snyderi]|nr:hypothetical protein DFP73DRAFT_567204 [Morchella snyderi]